MTARRIEPTRHLHGQHKGTEPHKYVPASHQSRDGILAQWMRSRDNQLNYPKSR